MHQCMPHQCVEGIKLLYHHTGQFWEEPEISCLLQQIRPSLHSSWPSIPASYCHHHLLPSVVLSHMQAQWQLHTCWQLTCHFTFGCTACSQSLQNRADFNISGNPTGNTLQGLTWEASTAFVAPQRWPAWPRFGHPKSLLPHYNGYSGPDCHASNTAENGLFLTLQVDPHPTPTSGSSTNQSTHTS